MQDLRQNKLWLRYCSRKGNRIVKIKDEKGEFIYGILLPLVFGLKMLKIQRASSSPDWEDLKRIKRRNLVVHTVIEPQKIGLLSKYENNGYRLSKFPYLATKTIVVDLRKTHDQLWKRLSNNAKRLIKKNSELIIKEVSEDVFLRLWKDNAKIWTLTIKDLVLMKKVLKNKVHFWVGFIEDDPQSGVLLIETKDTANYFHTFTTDKGRQNGSHFKTVWELILKEKRRGLSFLDFEGTYDPRWSQKKWVGFTEFKSKFGGKEISFLGCFQ